MAACVGDTVADERHDQFRDYVAARGTALLRTAYLLTGDHGEAEDLVQTALVKTYLSWRRIHDRGALDSYVRRAMVNTHISWWRRRKIDEYPTETLPEVPTPDPTARTDLHDALWRALGELPRRQRTAVVLRYYEDLTEPQVAQVMGVSVGTVKSTVSRAIDKLRESAELREPEEPREPPEPPEPAAEREPAEPRGDRHVPPTPIARDHAET